MKCKHPRPTLRASALQQHIDIQVIFSINEMIDNLAVEYRKSKVEEINNIAKKAVELRSLLYKLIHQRYDIVEDE